MPRISKSEKRDYDKKRRGWDYVRRRESERMKQRRAENPEACKLYGAAWKKKNPDRVKMSRERLMENIPRWYLKQLVKQQTGLPLDSIPENLIRLKRAHIKLTRRLKHERKKHR